MHETDYILKSIGEISYGGMFIVALLSNMVIPVPEEIILLAVGYLTGIGVFQYPMVMAIFILGMLVSDYILYSLSFRGSRLVKRLRERLQKKGYLRNEAYMKRHIKKIIFFSRFLVYLRFIGPVVAGSTHTKRKLFLTYDFLALLVYVNIFLGLGNYFHSQIFIISNGIAKFVNYASILIIIVVTIFVFRFLHKHFLRWFYQISEYISTIIPGLEQKTEIPAPKRNRR